jgi:hypothetical protein
MRTRDRLRECSAATAVSFVSQIVHKRKLFDISYKLKAIKVTETR